MVANGSSGHEHEGCVRAGAPTRHVTMADAGATGANGGSGGGGDGYAS